VARNFEGKAIEWGHPRPRLKACFRGARMARPIVMDNPVLECWHGHGVDVLRHLSRVRRGSPRFGFGLMGLGGDGPTIRFWKE
jgi:hypothetical protein